MRRREFLLSVAAVGSISLIARARAAIKKMVVYKGPNCGCCRAWTEAMKAAGFSVTTEEAADLAALKERYAIPAEMQGCHTAIVADYYVEGHVPLDAVNRLLGERPDIA
ncbi:hypothetical protein ILFOPFJJ_05598 [Ensifer psoraleae]|nr:hypothetical protein [Sinorhizobium psoraleae]